MTADVVSEIENARIIAGIITNIAGIWTIDTTSTKNENTPAAGSPIPLKPINAKPD